MIIKKGNLFEYKNADAICITTNGFLKKDNTCVMGRGVALTASLLAPSLPEWLGLQLSIHGNKVFLTPFKHNDAWLITFPVKPVTEKLKFDNSNVVKHMRKKVSNPVPRWACKARMDIIKKISKRISSFM